MKPMSSEVRDEDDALRARFLAPGDVLHLDYRSAARRATAYSPASGHEARPLRILTWNVERGIKAAEIIADLRRADADIVCLQEIDSGCDRSSGVDIGVAVAKALGLNYLFQLEFVELNSAAGQTLHGVHGNGILSKFDFSEAHSIDHRCQPYHWPRDGANRGEPRLGRRLTLGAVIQVPARYLARDSSPLTVDACRAALPPAAAASGVGTVPVATAAAETSVRTYIPPTVAAAALPLLEQYASLAAAATAATADAAAAATVPLVAYTAHAEPFCGITHRLDVIADILQHSRVMFDPSLASIVSFPSSASADPAAAPARVSTLAFAPQGTPRAPAHFQVFAGDLNTLAHSLARFSQSYARDALRWRSLGWAEAEWLAARVWAAYDYDDARAAAEARKVTGLLDEMARAEAHANPKRAAEAAAAAASSGPAEGAEPENLVAASLRTSVLTVPLPAERPPQAALTAAAEQAYRSSRGGVDGRLPRYMRVSKNAGYGHGRIKTVCSAFPLTRAGTETAATATVAAATFAAATSVASVAEVLEAADPDTIAGNQRANKSNSNSDDTVDLELPWAALTNPGFEEVFSPATATLTNYRGWFYGKLDHLVTRGIAAVAARTGNDDYAASDHKSLAIDGYLVPARMFPLRRPAEVPDAPEPPVTAATPRDYFESAPVKPVKLPPVLDPGLFVRLPVALAAGSGAAGGGNEVGDEVWVPALPCQLQWAYADNAGLLGYVRRNCTPFVTGVVAALVVLAAVLQALLAAA